MKKDITKYAIKIICQEPAEIEDLCWFGLDSIIYFKDGKPLYIRKPNSSKIDRFYAIKLSETKKKSYEIFHRYIIGGSLLSKNGIQEESLPLLLDRIGYEFIGNVLFDIFIPRSIWSISLRGSQIRPDSKLTYKQYSVFKNSGHFFQEKIGLDDDRSWRYLLHVLDKNQFLQANWFNLLCFADNNNDLVRKFKLSKKGKYPFGGDKIEGLEDYLQLVDKKQRIHIESLINTLSRDNIITIPACFDKFIGDAYEWELNIQIFSKLPLKEKLLTAISKYRTLFPGQIFIIHRPEDFYLNINDVFLKDGSLPDYVERY